MQNGMNGCLYNNVSIYVDGKPAKIVHIHSKPDSSKTNLIKISKTNLIKIVDLTLYNLDTHNKIHNLLKEANTITKRLQEILDSLEYLYSNTGIDS